MGGGPSSSSGGSHPDPRTYGSGGGPSTVDRSYDRMGGVFERGGAYGSTESGASGQQATNTLSSSGYGSHNHSRSVSIEYGSQGEYGSHCSYSSSSSPVDRSLPPPYPSHSALSISNPLYGATNGIFWYIFGRSIDSMALLISQSTSSLNDEILGHMKRRGNLVQIHPLDWI